MTAHSTSVAHPQLPRLAEAVLDAKPDKHANAEAAPTC